MRIDSIQLSEGSKISNLVVDSGTAFPATPNEGELFYKTTDDLLYVYDGSQWKSLAGVVSISGSGGTTGLTLTGGPITSSGTLTLGGTLAVSNGGTGTATAFTAGSVVFAGASGVYSQANSGLFWDNSSGSLGIGTSSPEQRLHLSNTGSTGVAIKFTNSAASAGIISYSNDSMLFYTSNAIRATIDTSGNLGLGVTPSAWNTSFKAVEFSAGSVAAISTNELDICQNNFYSASLDNWAYKNTAGATQYRQTGSEHRWYIAPSGTAGNAITFTQAMTLDASGNLGIGTSSPASKLHVAGDIQQDNSNYLKGKLAAGATTRLFGLNASDVLYIGSIDASHAGGTVFVKGGTTQMALDASGNLGIGTGSPAVKLEVSGTSSGSTLEVLRLSNAGSGASTQAQMKFMASSTNYGTISGGYGASAPQMTFDLPNATPGNYVWQVASAEKMRLDTSGNLGVGTTNPSAKLHIVGTMKADGYAVQNYVGANGVTTSTNNIGLLLQNSTALNSTGAASVTLQGIVSAPQVSHDATVGTTGVATTGFAANPVVTSSAATSGVSLRGFHSVTQRSYAADASSSSSSIIRAFDATFGHTATLPSTANTNNVQGIVLTGSVLAGTVNNIYSSILSQLSANPTTGSVTIGAMSPVYLNTSSIGTGAGTTTVSNYYGLTHVGLTVGANGTVTNAYELYLGGMTNSGTITNKYAVYQASTSLTNYFGSNVGIGTTAPVNKLDVVGSFGRGAPVGKTTNFTVAATENWLIVDASTSVTVTLPAAASWTGREIMIKTVTANAVVSASSNVVPIAGGSAATAILAATAGKWATLVSDGTNWIIMQAN